MGVNASQYTNYLGYDRCVPAELLATIGGVDIAGSVNLSEMIAHYWPDAVLVNDGLLNSVNFDQSSVRILDSGGWKM